MLRLCGALRFLVRDFNLNGVTRSLCTSSTPLKCAQTLPGQEQTIVDASRAAAYSEELEEQNGVFQQEQVESFSNGEILPRHYAPPPIEVWVRSFETGEKTGIMKLNNLVFGARPRLDIMHRVVVWQRAKRRAGNAKVKDRGEVAGGGRKPWRQKGSGRARHGSIRSPLWRGGGVVHGPRGPVSYDYPLPKKVRNYGMRSALSVKFSQGDLRVVDALHMRSHKTRDMQALVERWGWSSALLVDGGSPQIDLCRAASNMEAVEVLPSIGLNVHSMLLRPTLVLSVGAVHMLEQRLLASM